jgi:flagellar protein FliO/FliZ
MDRLIGRALNKLRIALPILFLSLSCSAQESAKTSVVATQTYPTAGGGSFIWLTLVTLVLAAALVALVAWYIKRSLQINLPNSSIKILASQSLGPRERIVIVEIAGMPYAIGHTPSQITMLLEMDPGDVKNLPQYSPIGSDFAKKLTDMVKKGLKA